MTLISLTAIPLLDGPRLQLVRATKDLPSMLILFIFCQQVLAYVPRFVVCIGPIHGYPCITEVLFLSPSEMGQRHFETRVYDERSTYLFEHTLKIYIYRIAQE